MLSGQQENRPGEFAGTVFDVLRYVCSSEIIDGPDIPLSSAGTENDDGVRAVRWKVGWSEVGLSTK